MEVFILLCDAAQHDAASGKINILGGDWSIADPHPHQTSVVVFYRASWEEAANPVQFELRLVDDDAKPVQVRQREGEEHPVSYSGVIALNESAAATANDLLRRVDVTNSFAVTVPPLRLSAGQRYTWCFDIDGETVSSFSFVVGSKADEE